MNTWTNSQEGKLENYQGGQKGQIATGSKKGKKLHMGGALPLLPHSYSPPLNTKLTFKIKQIKFCPTGWTSPYWTEMWVFWLKNILLKSSC